MKTLYAATRLVTCDGDPAEPGATAGDATVGAIDGGGVVVDGGCIVAVGDAAALSGAHPDAHRVDHPGLITPGLVDAHTHAAWVGSRGREYLMRMQGADYEAIARAGGGIVSSMHALRQASLDDIEAALRARLQRMAAMGVTTVEIKSGYGLDEATERRQLEAIRRVASDPTLPAVSPTFLGLHALPPETATRRDHAAACLGWLERIAADKLCRWVDAYIDRSAFSVEEARPVLERARDLGLGIRLHVGQFADVGGAELAAALDAHSADHLEHISEAGAHALATSGVHAVLLPVASFTLGQPPPPVPLLREAGVKLVVASDANPGTAPTESLPLAIALAIRSYGLTLREALLGATRHAAASLDSPAGVLRPGAPADLVLWDLPHEADLALPWGVPKAKQVLRAGTPLL